MGSVALHAVYEQCNQAISYCETRLVGLGFSHSRLRSGYVWEVDALGPSRTTVRAPCASTADLGICDTTAFPITGSRERAEDLQISGLHLSPIVERASPGPTNSADGCL